MAKNGIKAKSSKVVITIGEAFNEFIYEKQVMGKAKSTIVSYTDSYRAFIKFFSLDEDKFDINKVNYAFVMIWIDYMRNEDENKSDNTVNHYLRDIRAFLYWSMEKGYIEEEFKIKQIKVQEVADKFFTDDEVFKLVKKPSANASFVEWRTWAIINWVLATGNRTGTFTNIKLSDLDLKNKSVILRHTKNKRAQTPTLADSLIPIIKEYLDRYDTSNWVWLFPESTNASQLSAHGSALAFYRYCKRKGVSKTSIHGLRHTFARNWFLQGGDEPTLMLLLGHMDTTMVRHYASLYTQDRAEQVNAFNPLNKFSSNSNSRKSGIRRVK